MKTKTVRLADVPFRKRMHYAQLECVKARSVDERYKLVYLALFPGEATATVKA